MPTKESKIVKRTFDLKKRRHLRTKQARLDAVAPMPDEPIGYRDAPGLPGILCIKAATTWPHTKQQITLRMDAEVLEFFKHTGKRYQSRINAVLRSCALAHTQ